VELPELAGSSLGDLGFRAPVGADVERDGSGEAVPRRALDRIAAELDARVERPYDALAVRRGAVLWSAGAKAIRLGETVDLPAGFPASSLEVVRAPGGEIEARADGEPLGGALDPLYADAVAELERRGRTRFESFVVRADKVAGGRWHVAIDPL
jgi:hypothetical protein